MSRRTVTLHLRGPAAVPPVVYRDDTSELDLLGLLARSEAARATSTDPSAWRVARYHILSGGDRDVRAVGRLDR